MKSQELIVAIETAKLAGKHLLKYYQKSIRPEKKSDDSFVSIADKEAQDLIEENLLKNFPEYNFLGEESFDKNKEIPKTKTWVVDPLDGTSNFLLGIPHFCVSIGLIENDQSILGVIYNPVTNELFYAEKSKSYYYNDIQVEDSKSPIRSAIVGRFFSDNNSSIPIDKKLYQLKTFLSEFDSVRSLGASALDMAFLSIGRADFFWQRGLSIWDIAAAQCILKEAGYGIWNETGEDYSLYRDSSLVVAQTKEQAKKLLNILND